MSSCELSFILLAAFGLMDLAESAKAKRLFTVTTSVMLLGLIWIVLAASSLNDRHRLRPPRALHLRVPRRDSLHRDRRAARCSDD